MAKAGEKKKEEKEKREIKENREYVWVTYLFLYIGTLYQKYIPKFPIFLLIRATPVFGATPSSPPLGSLALSGLWLLQGDPDKVPITDFASIEALLI